MMTYYMAQMGIAVSVVDSHKSSEINHLVIQHNHLIDGFKSLFYQLKATLIECTTSEELILVKCDNGISNASRAAEEDNILVKND